MKVITKTITLLFLVILYSCSENESLNDVSPEGDFKIYSSANTDIDLVISGSDETYEYEVYGEFKETSTPDFNVPKNLKIVKQKIKGENEYIVINMDRKYIPQSFYKVVNNVVNDTVYHVYYNEDVTIINHDIKDDNGFFKTVFISELNGISSSTSKLAKIKGDDDDCDPFEDDGELDPCSDNHILKQMGDEWTRKEYSVVKSVGKFISWIMTKMKNTLCDEKNTFKTSVSKAAEVNSFSCEDYEKKEEDSDVCNFVSECAYDCNGVLFGSAYMASCIECIGGNTGKKECTAPEEFNVFGEWTITISEYCEYDDDSDDTSFADNFSRVIILNEDYTVSTGSIDGNEISNNFTFVDNVLTITSVNKDNLPFICDGSNTREDIQVIILDYDEVLDKFIGTTTSGAKRVTGLDDDGNGCNSSARNCEGSASLSR